ncbi:MULTISPECIES: hypothetical protein [unclassified Phaeobacter]|uniref:hypothetical protein n=2 Tax=unclassified Phaeobacter TaxID=2621772 RepID=UPI003A8997D8
MIFETENWKAATPSDLVGFLDRKSKSESSKFGALLAFRSKLSPLTVYKYLVARFGEPNGFMTLSKRSNDSDNLVHWDFLLLAGEHRIWIQGGSRDVQVGISGRKMSPLDWVKFVNALKRDFGNQGKKMSAIGHRLQKWKLVSNRYALIAEVCAGYHEVLNENSASPDFSVPRRTSSKGIKQYQRKIRGMGARSSKLFGAAISLELLTPILAESFINLLIFALRREELRQNVRQYETFVRQPIDTRVFDLHLKCVGFIGGVDATRSEYENFKKVMDRRNLRVHGNVDVSVDEIEEVFFDDYIPLYREGGDPILTFFENQEKVFDIDGVLERYHHAHEFMAYVRSLVKPKYMEGLNLMMEDTSFGFDESRKIMGRLFPSHEATMVVPVQYDDELKVDWGKWD